MRLELKNEESQRDLGDMGGRTNFNSELVEQILDLVSEGQSVKKSCEKIGVKLSTFHGWVLDDRDGLRDKYARAIQLRMSVQESLLEEIADEEPLMTPNGVDSAWVARQKMRLDARKWIMSKLAPRKYGDKVEIAGSDDQPLKVAQITRVIIDRQELPSSNIEAAKITDNVANNTSLPESVDGE